MDGRYDVFLSHSSEDKLAVERLALRLREEAGLRPFLDKWHLVPGSTWIPELEVALATSDAAAAVFFGSSGDSKWRLQELQVALHKAVKSPESFRVFAVLLPGASVEQVPDLLKIRGRVDFRDGLDDRSAFAMLVAGIKGQPIEPGSFDLPDTPAPYRGLLRFEEQDAAFFFGREEDIRRTVANISRSSFVAVVGASGSGKSSLIRAGVIHRLNQDGVSCSSRWHKLTVIPGRNPLRAMADQLSRLVPSEERLRKADELTARLSERDDGLRTAVSNLLVDQPVPVLLFVDQFEELFTHQSTEPRAVAGQTERFIANLTDAAAQAGNQFRIVITLRADFLDRCLTFPSLDRLIENGLILLGNLRAQELEQAIYRPAQTVGAFFEPGVVSLILRDVLGEPGSLPLLQHALHELWRARRGRWLTLKAYEDSDGVAGALKRRAQEVYEALSPQERKIARHVLLRAVFIGEDTKDTRRRVPRDELYPSGATRAAVDKVIQALSSPQARLIVADQEDVEIAHEALIEKWPQIRRWIAEEREGLRVHRTLSEAARSWHANGGDESLVTHRGARLALAEEWASSHRGAMTELELRYLTACREHHARERLNQARLQANRILSMAATQDDPQVSAFLAAELVRYPEVDRGLHSSPLCGQSRSRRRVPGRERPANRCKSRVGADLGRWRAGRWRQLDRIRDGRRRGPEICGDHGRKSSNRVRWIRRRGVDLAPERERRAEEGYWLRQDTGPRGLGRRFRGSRERGE
jgi:hypothetical protein